MDTCTNKIKLTGATPVALVMPSMKSMPKLDTPMARTFDLGRAIMAFQVSTREVSSSSADSPGIVG